MPVVLKGQRYVDEQGTHWRIDEMAAPQNLDGFYIVTLSYGITPACEHGVWVLARREFEALCRERRFVLQDQDGLPVPSHGPPPRP